MGEDLQLGPFGFEGRTRTLLSPPGLPGQISLTGRECDRLAIDMLVRYHRMVTVVGPGGVGKSAVAQAVVAGWMREGRHAVCIDMAQPPSGQLLAFRIAQSISWPFGGLHSHPVNLQKLGRSRDILVLLDNAQADLPEVCETVRDALAAPRGLRFLVTSRAASRIEGEQIHQLGARPLRAGSYAPTAGTATDWSGDGDPLGLIEQA